MADYATHKTSLTIAEPFRMTSTMGFNSSRGSRLGTEQSEWRGACAVLSARKARRVHKGVLEMRLNSLSFEDFSIR